MSGKSTAAERFIVLYIPWLFSVLFSSSPELSYMIAWLGSFFIFAVTLTGWVKPLPADRSIAEQMMRPIFLMHIIFAGYTCCTSIFYFLDQIGYEDFHKALFAAMPNMEQLKLTAQCQRYYCLGHAALVTGILVNMNYPAEKKFKVDPDQLANVLLRFAVISLPVALLFLHLPGLSQFSNQFNTLSFIAGTLALAFAIPLKKPANIAICGALYLFNFYNAFVSGFKEPIIISILVLGIFLYPSYKKAVMAIFVPAIMVLFIFLPTYNHAFRQSAWTGDANSDEASQVALDAALNSDEDLTETNWDFAVYRLSEIDMFTRFVSSTPTVIDFYGFTLLKQSLIAIVPRVFWPSKPITEDLVMERVYSAGVVYRASKVSAKPAFIVDAYLSYGSLGVFVILFTYGAVAQIISQKAEFLFGGYLLGTALIFSGLFQIFWRGLSFEFLINNVFWSYISMLVIAKILVSARIVKPV